VTFSANLSQVQGAASAASAALAAPVAEARGVSKQLGSTTALRDVSLAVMPGESHALVGRNGAGKSTLVSMLTGLRQPDTGAIRFNGEPAPPVSDSIAWRKHVACVYQHSPIIRELTVAENLFINRQPLKRGWIDWPALRRQARELLDTWQVDVHEDMLAADLTVEARQLVEIARALSYGARFIILDEPTAQLDGEEIKRLFKRVRELQQNGVTFLFISHHLQEIYDICQTVTVLRDARHIVTTPVDAMPKDKLIEAMTGERGGLLAADAREREPLRDAPAVLDLAHLSGEDYDDVSLTVRRGEVVGLTGATSSGRTSVGEAVAGLKRPTAGHIRVNGQAMPLGDVAAALARRVSCVPKDRHHEGLVLTQSVGENATMTIPRLLGKFGFIAPERKRTVAEEMIKSLGIVAQGPEHIVSGLSGGNQQKVVMARALANAPDVLVLIDPTAGVDVKSKQALLAVVERVRQEGKAVLLVSSELDDLRACDRVLVMSRGAIQAEYAAGWDDSALIASIEGVSLNEK
jgi:simple sugar transport system ATP-binding protein